MIGSVVRELRSAFPRVVCVDDGSPDRSAPLAADAGARVVRHPVNLGQGAAVQTGIEFALLDPACRYVVTFDGDGQHRVGDAIRMVELLRTGSYDVVLGYRFLGSAEGRDLRAARAAAPAGACSCWSSPAPRSSPCSRRT